MEMILIAESLLFDFYVMIMISWMFWNEWMETISCFTFLITSFATSGKGHEPVESEYRAPKLADFVSSEDTIAADMLKPGFVFGNGLAWIFEKRTWY